MEEAILIFQFSKTFNKKKTFLINHEKHEQITTLMLYHIHYQHYQNHDITIVIIKDLIVNKASINNLKISMICFLIDTFIKKKMGPR